MCLEAEAGQQLEGKHAQHQPGEGGQAEARELRAACGGPADQQAEQGVVDQEGNVQGDALRWQENEVTSRAPVTPTFSQAQALVASSTPELSTRSVSLVSRRKK